MTGSEWYELLTNYLGSLDDTGTKDVNRLTHIHCITII